jgi:hypothetical protein
MAFLAQRADRFRIIFRYAGQRYAHTLRTTDRKEAEILKGGAEMVLLRLEQGLLELPDGADLVSFVMNDGRCKENAPRRVRAADPKRVARSFQANRRRQQVGQTSRLARPQALLRLELRGQGD